MNYGGLFDLNNKENQLKNLETEINKENFWDNVNKANEIIKEMNHLNKLIDSFKNIKKKSLEIESLLNDELDQELLIDIEKEIESIGREIESMKLNTLLSGKYDENNCIIEIHPGAGGTESCDWANMLYRMYKRYCEKKGYTFEVIYEQKGEETGIKNLVAKVSGLYAYGYLKSEIGVHRLVRISPFDSNSRRHTSFASVSVIPEIINDNTIIIKPEDIKIDVYHSGGAGGQSVNTTDSAVRITHIPTNIIVVCQNERSQLKNKESAMNILLSKLTILEEIKQKEKIANLKGNSLNIDFGSQIRSYVLEPYKMIKDNRFDFETGNTDAFLDGEIEDVMIAYLKNNVNSN